jgi:L-alanine-DL-glutamate epimerase-like enolase superfamily enzyme
MPSLNASVERWPLREPFRISRRTFVDSLILTVRLADGSVCGAGEAEPHEWDDAVAAAVLDQARALARQPRFQALDRQALQRTLPAGALRSAIDCAFWDLSSKQAGQRAWTLAGLAVPDALPVMSTLSLDAVDAMAAAAQRLRGAPLVKLKLGAGDGLDLARLDAVAQALGGTPLLIDANGGFSREDLTAVLGHAARCHVVVIEQPFPPGHEHLIPAPVAGLRFCADESCIDRSSLPSLARHFQMVNIKLDKCGGLTEGLALAEAAQRLGLACMVGSNGGSSLAVAPAYLLAAVCEFADLGAGHLCTDREPPMTMRGSWLQAPPAALWG